MAKSPDRERSAFKPLLDTELAEAVKASAQQIWLAGMGAFAKAQAEGGKVFEKLVKEGAGLQKRTQTLAEEGLDAASAKASAMADEVTAQAASSWDKLESIFEARTAKALARLGVPTATELAALQARVDALQAQVTALAAKCDGTAERPEPHPPARKASAKRPASKKTDETSAKAATRKAAPTDAATPAPRKRRRPPSSDGSSV